MSIRIPVSADASGLTDALGKSEKAATGVEKAVEGIAEAAQQAGKAIDDLGRKAANTVQQVTYDAARLKQIREQIHREFGGEVSIADAQRAALNFEKMRSSRSVGARQMRRAADLGDWLATSRLSAQSGQAKYYRRELVAATMSGTRFAEQNNLNPEPEPEESGGGGFERGIKRAQSSAIGFVKGGFALAGIGSLFGMAGQAVTGAADEAVSIDTLKRRISDVGISFDDLRSKVRAAADGLGIAYADAARLGQQFAKIAGNVNPDQIRGGIRSSVGFSRAYGLDPETGVEFFGAMSRLGVARDENSQRRLALMIGEAVEKSGYSAKSDELIAAIANFANEAARMTLAAPNVGGYAGLLAGMTKDGVPPDIAANVLGAANSSLMRFGSAGLAGKNFLYAALGRGTDMDPISAMALAAGGLAGTTASVFGRGSIMGRYLGSANDVRLDDVTNFEKIKSLLNQQYGGDDRWHKMLRANAMQGLFGLQSPEQAAALLMLKPADITKSVDLLGKNFDFSKLNATAMQAITHVAGAKNMAGLEDIQRQIAGRTDISPTEQGKLVDAIRGGDFGKAQQTFAQILATHGQEQTKGSETRQAVVDLKDTLTDVGKNLLDPLNAIRKAVVAMAHVIAPGEYAKQERADQISKDIASDYDKNSAYKSAVDGIDAIIKRRGLTAADLDRIAPRPDAMDAVRNDPNSWAGKAYQRAMATRQGAAHALGIYDADVPADWRGAMLAADRELGLKTGTTAKQFWYENRFTTKTSKEGAVGYAQIMPGTESALEQRLGRKFNPNNFFDALTMRNELMREALARYHGNAEKAFRDYHGGPDQSKWGPWNNAYAEFMMRTPTGTYGTPLPDGHPAAAAGKGTTAINLGLTGEFVMPLKDQHGNQIGTGTIKPFQIGTPAGTWGPGL